MDSVIKVELTVIKNGSYWEVRNKDLILIGSLSQLVIDAFTDGDIATGDEFRDREWVEWARKFPSKLSRITPGDEWSIKIKCWLSSINKRRAPTERAKSNYSTVDWSTSIQRMKSNIRAKELRHARIAADPWSLWCESSGSNSCKRSKEKANSKRISVKAAS